MTEKAHITIDEAIQRYIAAFDELEYIGEQIATMMKGGDKDTAKDYLEAMIEKAESLQEDLQLLLDDSEGE